MRNTDFDLFDDEKSYRLVKEIGDAIIEPHIEAGRRKFAGKDPGLEGWWRYIEEFPGAYITATGGPNTFQLAVDHLSRSYGKLRDALCAKRDRRKKILEADETTAVTLIADFLNPLTLGFPVLTLSTLVGRIGIKRLCAGNPFQPPPSFPRSESYFKDSDKLPPRSNRSSRSRRDQPTKRRPRA